MIYCQQYNHYKGIKCQHYLNKRAFFTSQTEFRLCCSIDTKMTRWMHDYMLVQSRPTLLIVCHMERKSINVRRYSGVDVKLSTLSVCTISTFINHEWEAILISNISLIFPLYVYNTADVSCIVTNLTTHPSPTPPSTNKQINYFHKNRYTLFQQPPNPSHV